MGERIEIPHRLFEAYARAKDKRRFLQRVGPCLAMILIGFEIAMAAASARSTPPEED